MKLDADLQAIQEVRQFLYEAKAAQKQLETKSQAQIDRITEAMAEAAEREAVRLGVLACEETGFGNARDKAAKNRFVAHNVYEAIKEMKTVGIIHRDDARKVWEVAQPVGIIAAIIPSTNPTSTVMFKCMIALKARNAIVISPHPSALRCSLEAAKVMREAAEAAGAPEGLIHCLPQPSVEASRELMTHKLTDLILATGGTAMVKAAYSSGKPAYGVGPGNVPVYIHHSAEITKTVIAIMQSKTFDYGTICASEQALVVDRSIRSGVLAALQQQGAYVLQEQEKRQVEAVISTNGGRSLNPKVVGQSPQKIAAMAGISIPDGTRVLLAEETEVGLTHPFSIEKLSPLLAFYTVEDWQEGCRRCMELLELGGLGHTLGIHCEDERVIEAFGLEKPASRIIVNAGTTFGGIGATTGILPSMTLGCGSFGNNITSDNIGPMHLLNIKRVAFGIREMATEPPPAPSGLLGEQVQQLANALQDQSRPGVTRDEVMQIVKRVLAEMQLG